MSGAIPYGQAVLSEILPPDLYRPGQVLNKSTTSKLFADMADRYPDQYAGWTSRLMRLGLRAGESFGGASFSLDDLTTPDEVQQSQQETRARVAELLDRLPDGPERNQAISDILFDAAERSPGQIVQAGRRTGNKFITQLEGAGRGNAKTLSSILSGDQVAFNSAGKPLPVPITHGYAQGQSMAEYLAGAYEGRRGITTTKLCLSGDTSVRMADGSVKHISDIQVGELVLGADEEGLLSPVKVLNTFQNGVRECYEYRFRHNCCKNHFVTLKATPDHKILSAKRRSDSIFADQLYRPAMRALREASIWRNPKKNNFVAIPGRGFDAMENFGELSVPEALIAGLMLGDGCMTESAKSFQLSCGDPLLIEDANPMFREFGMELNHGSGYGYTIRMIPELATGFYAAGSVGGVRTKQALTPLKRWLIKHLGRKLAHQKKLPANVWSWDEPSLARLIAGIFSTDGCFVTKSGNLDSFSLVMTAKDLLEEVRTLLSVKFGIWATPVSLERPAGVANSVNDLWVIRVMNKLCLTRLKERFGHYLVGVKRREVERSDVVVKYSEHLGKLLSLNKFGFKLHSRRLVGDIPTYDIEVDHPNHAFLLANGLIVSNSVASSGYLSKLLQQAAHRALTVAEDDDQPVGHDRGLLVDVDDEENIGSLLARQYGPYPKDTVISPKVLAGLKRMGKFEKIIVRSPVASSSLDGGVYAKDLGIREYGRLPLVGEQVGLPAAQAIGEKITQGSLGAKHGASSVKKKQTPGLAGFDLMERLANPPQESSGLAVHAEQDGRVTEIRPAPQGGQYVLIGDREHYVSPEFEITVRPGDTLEAGEPLTDGIQDPAQVARLRGLGEGRRVMVESMQRGLRESGNPVARRNLELLARGLYDRVEIEEEFDEFLPGDVVPYGRLEKLYRPRPDSQVLDAGEAIGNYLEVPTLHHTIGTRITPRIRQQLDQAGIRQITVNRNPPPFRPRVTRAQDLLQSDPDFMTRFMGSHLQTGLLDSITRAGESDENSTSFVPVRASGVNLMKSKFRIGNQS